MQETTLLCDDNLPVIANLFDDADNQLFKRILANDKHILHHCMPQRTTANILNVLDLESTISISFPKLALSTAKIT